MRHGSLIRNLIRTVEELMQTVRPRLEAALVIATDAYWYRTADLFVNKTIIRL